MTVNKTGNTDQKSVRDASEHLSKYDMVILFYMLKGVTSEDHALSAPTLAQEMRKYLGEDYSSKTLKRGLDQILEIQDFEKEKDRRKRAKKKELAGVLYSMFGGRILTVGEKYLKYYFEPCLDEASMRMLNGTVVSNRFLSSEEKSYLLTRMKLLNMLGDFNDITNDVERSWDITIKPEPEEGNIIPGDSSMFIWNTVFLDHAIRMGWQVRITYGIYDVYDNGIDYHKRQTEEGDKIYTLNPYAMFWNGGHYYLLATYAYGTKPDYIREEGTPVHFRVDRIVDVRPAEKRKSKGGKRTAVYAEREDVPPRLEPFLEMGENDDKMLDFDSLAYCARFPGMRISEHSNLIDCTIECTKWSLQILVDAFGTLISVRESTRKHLDDELDYNGRSQKFLEAKMEQVEFENMRDFCLANPEYLTPLSPPRLVRAVKDKLQQALDRLG